jgi:hypothetical protein
LTGLLEREADRVQSSIQTIFSERIDLEMVGRAVRRGDLLRRQIHRQLIAFAGRHALEERLDFWPCQHHGENTVLKAVVVEDIREAGGEDATKPLIEQRPGRMFA